MAGPKSPQIQLQSELPGQRYRGAQVTVQGRPAGVINQIT